MEYNVKCIECGKEMREEDFFDIIIDVCEDCGIVKLSNPVCGENYWFKRIEKNN